MLFLSKIVSTKNLRLVENLTVCESSSKQIFQILSFKSFIASQKVDKTENCSA